jgi:hypothetical protein
MALLFGSDKDNARKNFTVLTNFAKLNATVQAEIVQFTDAAGLNASGKPNSTLIEFCQDLQNTNGFVAFLNEADKFLFVKDFLGYRHNYGDEDYSTTLGEIEQIEAHYGNGIFEKVKYWHDHAVTASNRNGKFQEGKQFENWITIHLGSNQSPTYLKLKDDIAKLPNNPWNLDDYSIYTQVQFCINGSAPCNAEKEYFIADFVFVKEETDPITGVKKLDVKIADTKLTAGTKFTKNQALANKIPSSFYIKSYKVGTPIYPNPIKGQHYTNFIIGGKVSLISSKFYKIYSNGTPTSYGGIKL